MPATALAKGLAIGVILALSLVGCGGNSSNTKSGPKAQANGTVRWAYDMSGQTGTPGDPTGPVQSAAGHIQRLIYDSLLRADKDDKLHPGLAESVVATNPTTITISLHSGVKFTDDTLLDADAVKSALDRGLKARQPIGYGSIFFSAIDQVRVDSSLKLTILLKTPTPAPVIHELAYQAGEIPSPTAIRNGDINTHPVGAGPFIAETWEPGKKIVLTKNPSYFQASEIKLGRIEIEQVTQGASGVNALLSGAYDVEAGAWMIPQYLDAFRNQPKFHVVDFVNPNFWTTTSLCLATAPLTDLRVRQALYYAVDTSALNQIVYQGRGEMWTQFWPSSSPFYDPSIKNPYQPRNLTKAKQLLAEAGQPNPKFTVVYGPTGANPQIFAFLQQQWKDAGFEVSGYPTAGSFSEYYSPNRIPPHAQAFAPIGGSAYQDRLRFFIPNDFANPCNNGDSTIRGVLDQLRATDPNDIAKQKALWSQASKWQLANLNNLWFLWAAQGLVYSDKLGGTSYVQAYSGDMWPDFRTMYVKG